jgi:hypothetical protein
VKGLLTIGSPKSSHTHWFSCWRVRFGPLPAAQATRFDQLCSLTCRTFRNGYLLVGACLCNPIIPTDEYALIAKLYTKEAFVIEVLNKLQCLISLCPAAGLCSGLSKTSRLMFMFMFRTGAGIRDSPVGMATGYGMYSCGSIPDMSTAPRQTGAHSTYYSRGSWLRCCATSWKITSSYHDEVTGIFSIYQILPPALWPWSLLSL